MLGTRRKNGRPWVQPLWYVLDGDDVIIVLIRDSVAGHAMAREPHAVLCVDDEQPPYRFATLECRAQAIDAPQEAALWLRRLIVRYLPTVDADARVDDYIETGVRLVRLMLDRVTYQSQVVA